MDGIVKDDAGRHEQLREPPGVDTVLPVLLEVDARLPEEVDGVRDEDVAVNVELPEIELPDYRAAGGRRGGEVPGGVGEGEAELQEVEEVDVGAEGVVVGVSGLLEVPEVADDNAGELGVHGDVGEVVNDVADHSELRLKVSGPHVADLDGVFFTLRHRWFQIRSVVPSGSRRIRSPRRSSETPKNPRSGREKIETLELEEGNENLGRIGAIQAKI